MLSLTLLDSGMRAGELCNLMDSDIDWYNGTIRVQGKTGQRRCIVSDTLRPLLRDWIDLKNAHLQDLSERLSRRYKRAIDLRNPYVFPAFRIFAPPVPYQVVKVAWCNRVSFSA